MKKARGPRPARKETSGRPSGDPAVLRLGERIREVRRGKRLRQKALARLIGLSPGALTNFERGRRRISVDWLQKIADALDTPVVYFLVEGRRRGGARPGDPRERRLLQAWSKLADEGALRQAVLHLLQHLEASLRTPPLRRTRAH